MENLTCNLFVIKGTTTEILFFIVELDGFQCNFGIDLFQNQETVYRICGIC